MEPPFRFVRAGALLSGVVLFLNWAALDAVAVALRIPNQDAEAIARGNAFVATADNPSAVYYNPAGVALTPGTVAQYGVHSISVNSRYESPSGGITRTRFEVQPVPEFFATHKLGTGPFSLGLGVYAPFGLGLEWPSDAPFREAGLEGRLQFARLNPVLAWRPHPNFSIGGGPTLNYGRLKLRQALAPPGEEFKFDGEAFAYGANAGLLWSPHPQWSIGASYHSANSLHTRGKTTARPLSPPTGTRADFDFPQFILAGVSYRPTTNWNAEVAIDWTDWNEVNTVMFQGASGGDIPLALNWRSSLMYHFGVTRYLTRGWQVSAGYFFSENSTSERNFSPLVPDTDLHVGSVGAAYKGIKWRSALAVQIMTGPSRTVDESQPGVANGKYHFFNPAVTFSVGRIF